MSNETNHSSINLSPAAARKQLESGSDGRGNFSSSFMNFRFTGDASEYFGIWIVNLLLSIITLGIYSAWAKVRRETYFKNNTKVFDAGFGYHASGGQIFKGRLIALVVLVFVSVITTVQPLFSLILYPAIFFLLPWILNNSIRFSARMTSFRNIRFNWKGTYWRTLWFLVVAPIFGLFSLGLLTPIISKSYYSYFARSHTYGTTSFMAKPKASDFYIAFILGAVLPTLLIGSATYIIFNVISSSFMSSAIWATIPVVIYVFIFLMTFVYSAMCRNLMVRSLKIEGILEFESKINPIKFAWILVSNLVLSILSLGLLVPWSKVRIYRYLSSVTMVKAIGDIENFIDEAVLNQSSIGEGVADLEGVEVSV